MPGRSLKVREMSFLVSGAHEAVSDGYEAVSDDYEAVSDGCEAVSDGYEAVSEAHGAVSGAYGSASVVEKGISYSGAEHFLIGSALDVRIGGRARGAGWGGGSTAVILKLFRHIH